MGSLALPPPGNRSEGGQGDQPTRGDLRLIRQAVNGRWPISPELRRATVETLEAIVTYPDNFDSRTVVSAAKTLLDADRINQEDERRTVPVPDQITDQVGRKRLDFSRMTDAELARFIEGS